MSALAQLSLLPSLHQKTVALQQRFHFLFKQLNVFSSIFFEMLQVSEIPTMIALFIP